MGLASLTKKKNLYLHPVKKQIINNVIIINIKFKCKTKDL